MSVIAQLLHSCVLQREALHCRAFLRVKTDATHSVANCNAVQFIITGSTVLMSVCQPAIVT